MSASFTWSSGSPDGVKKGIKDGVVLGLVNVAVQMQKFVRKRLSIPGTGRRYRVARGTRRGRNQRARGWHQASAPGNPPAAMNGHLRNSWTLIPSAKIGSATTRDQGFAYIDENRSRGTVVYVLGSNLVYARALEFGHGRLRPRPYIRDVVEGLRPLVPDLVSKGMKAHMRRMGGRR